jgi:hypothetical protein
LEAAVADVLPHFEASRVGERIARSERERERERVDDGTLALYIIGKNAPGCALYVLGAAAAAPLAFVNTHPPSRSNNLLPGLLLLLPCNYKLIVGRASNTIESSAQHTYA